MAHRKGNTARSASTAARSQATFVGFRIGGSAAKNDVAEIDARISIVVLVVVVQVVNSEVKEAGPQQRKGEVELSGTLRKRFVERRACAGGDGVGAGFGSIAEVEGRVLQGLLVAGAYDAISTAGLKLHRGAGDGANLDGVAAVKCPLDFRCDSERVLQRRWIRRCLRDADDQRDQDERDDSVCFHGVMVLLFSLPNGLRQALGPTAQE
jgi:hypothetical protein